ncbi:MAG TPA: site-specific integrase [Polyangia bacterium]|nr:site-specific integrase [Polyangia bacterium]
MRDDQNRWAKHLAPLLDHRTPDKVGTDLIDELVADLKTKLEPAGVERVLYVLSGFYRWAIRRKVVAHNPVRDYLADLERTERNAIRTTHDPRDTPFIKDRADVVKLFAELQEELPAAAIAYALSALAGLRPGEAVGLEWGDLDLDAGRAMVRRRVRHGEVHTPKSGKPREVPLVPSLVAVLRAWRAKVPADEPLVVPSQRKTGKKAKKVKHLGAKAIADALEKALAKAKLPALTFYEAGRHTFASQWVLAGLDVYRLSEIMGHASVTTTQRCAHLTAKVPDAMLARADIPIAAA